MINDLDEALRRLLTRELPITNGEISLAFDQPNREWSGRLNRPTLNLFLHDVRENKKLRQRQEAYWERTQDPKAAPTQRRLPVRVDLHYLITAWTTDPDDEHRLLTRTLLALFRYQDLPEDVLPESLRRQKVPIPLQVAQYDEAAKPTDIWSVLDNEMRPAVNCLVTLPLDPHTPITAPLIRTRELRFGQRDEAGSRPQLDAEGVTGRYWTVGGTVRSRNGPPANLRARLVERGVEVMLQPEGRFAIGNLQAGEYTLEVSAEGRPTSRHKIIVPAPDYDIEV